MVWENKIIGHLDRMTGQKVCRGTPPKLYKKEIYDSR